MAGVTVLALDASAIISLLDAGDAHHEAVTTVISNHPGVRLIAHPLTIAESLVHADRAGVATAASAAMAGIGLDAAAVDERAPLRFARLRNSTRLRMPDCCVLDAALERDAALVTFDDRLAAAAQALGLETLS